MEYKLEDLLDVPLLQNLQEKLNLVYSFPSAIADIDGKILTAVAWQDICTKFHRVNPLSEKECIKSSQYIKDHFAEASPSVCYTCPLGLVDCATPIIIDGMHLGNFLTGQFFLEKPDMEFFKQQAKKYGFKEKEYLDAVMKVPEWTKEKLDLYLDFIKGFIEVVSGLGSKNLKEIEANKSIKESEERYNTIIETSIDGFCITDKTGLILEVNDTYCEMCGYNREEFLTKRISDLAASESGIALQNHIKDVIKTGKARFETKHNRKDGSIFDVELSIHYRSFNGGQFVAFVRDISEHKKSDKILHEIIENNPMSIQIVDTVGCSLKINSAHTELFGAVPPPDFSIFKDLEQKGLGKYIALAKSGKVARFPDLCYNVHDVSPEFPDNPTWIRSLIFPLKDSEGNPERYVIMHENINETKKAEQQVEKQLLFTTALNDIAVLINLIDNPEEILENANRIVGETLQVDRTLIYDVSFDTGYITGMCEWIREEHPDIEHTKGVYPIDMFKNPLTHIRQSETYITSSSDKIGKYFLKDDSGKTLHEGFKIKSLIWFPLAFDEHGYYLFTINQILKNREWTNEEIGFLYSVAKQINLALMKIRMLEEKKDIEDKLKLNLERLELATKSSEMGIWDWDMEANRLEWSKEMFLLFGLDNINEDASFETWDKVLHPEDKEIVYKRMEDAVKEKMQLVSEYRVVHPDGQVRWIIAIGNATYDETGKAYRLSGICIDTTKRKLIEEEIETKHNLLLKLSNQVPGVIYQYRLYTDGSSCFPYSSNGMNMIYEYSSEEVRKDATPVFSRIHPEDADRVSELILESAKTLELFECEFRVILPQQGLRWRYSTAMPERMEDGSTLWHGIISDITERKHTEMELIKAKEKAEESDRLKSSFLANMSHEIRTPMNGILGFAQLLKEPKLSGEEQSHYIEVIEKSGRRMLNIINDIVDISKIESGQMKVFITKTNINKQMEYINTFFNPEIISKGMNLKCKSPLPDTEATIKTDREKIYAIFTNLVKNAIKYTNEGTIEFGYEKKGKFIEFFVKDTGIGIAAERQEAIFERFVQADLSDTRALQGAGLGLAITKAYVEMLGGKIWVESETGKGTTFYFTIPYVISTDEHLSIKLNRTIDEENDIENLNILIAEDDEGCELLLRNIVRKYCKNITTANNGYEAVNVCRNNTEIDLILMDIKMPRMDGYEAVKEIRKFNKDVIIIAQTAFALAGDREKSILAGCNDYVSKPINKQRLNEFIHKYFGGEHRRKRT